MDEFLAGLSVWTSTIDHTDETRDRSESRMRDESEILDDFDKVGRCSASGDAASECNDTSIILR